MEMILIWSYSGLDFINLTKWLIKYTNLTFNPGILSSILQLDELFDKKNGYLRVHQLQSVGSRKLGTCQSVVDNFFTSICLTVLTLN